MTLVWNLASAEMGVDSSSRLFMPRDTLSIPYLSVEARSSCFSIADRKHHALSSRRPSFQTISLFRESGGTASVTLAN
jgi:hypothetical protein